MRFAIRVALLFSLMRIRKLLSLTEPQSTKLGLENLKFVQDFDYFDYAFLNPYKVYGSIPSSFKAVGSSATDPDSDLGFFIHQNNHELYQDISRNKLEDSSIRSEITEQEVSLRNKSKIYNTKKRKRNYGPTRIKVPRLEGSSIISGLTESASSPSFHSHSEFQNSIPEPISKLKAERENQSTVKNQVQMQERCSEDHDITEPERYQLMYNSFADLITRALPKTNNNQPDGIKQLKNNFLEEIDGIILDEDEKKMYRSFKELIY
ncbi:hypothetical protein BY996DRAFT_6416267 [Phakopsora pachyrhizi]|uniref:Expressed protein n=1 Tax=Phakopsora pachyrhizi TaxID=170000 RepID=A0AAV0BG16_PHAPC|nr:hypothetical protein BY996DRAFT_6425394 [Phakopsora pachyrhizi]KAI8451562.1 hypothetical protein BY996DRAFT_6416267 [Phakopsora pachyrhizi]CAH7666082.1 expressed protein [Phakopsora pachyrhizi]CAH7684986.1 expressed protein [Phakopsora pachyrhizi]